MAKPPDEAALHEAALAHLARFATTEAGLLRVLNRRVQRWAARERLGSADPDALVAQVQASGTSAAELVRRLVAAGLVDDEAYASNRAARLSRSGRSRRVIAAHLAARGIDAATVSNATTSKDVDEYGAAILFARRRRLGPFRPLEAAPGDNMRIRDLGAFARAGFPRDIAVRVIALTRSEADAAALRLRRT